MKQEYVIVWIMRFVNTSKAKIQSAYSRFRMFSKQFFQSRQRIVAEPKPWVYAVPYPDVISGHQSPKRSKLLYFFLVTIIIAFVGLIAVACVNLDEGYWMVNGRLFLTAIENQDWPGTYVSTDAAHPGVSVMWISALIWKIFSPTGEAINHLHRLIFFIIRIGGIGAILFLLRTKFKVALNGVVLMGLYLSLNAYVGMGLRATWLDQLLTIGIVLASMSWLLYLREKKDQWIVAAGVFWGLALATKIMALFWVPMITVITIILLPKIWQQGSVIWAGIKVGVIGILIYFVLFPAAVMNPLEVPLSRFIGETAEQHIEITIGGSGVDKTIPYYPVNWFSSEGTIGVGITIVLYYLINFRKNSLKQNPLLVFGILGSIYVFILMLPALLIRDQWGDKEYALLAVRYMAPAIPLMSVLVFDELQKKGQVLLKAILVCYLIVVTIMENDSIASNLAAVEQFLLRFIF